MRKNQLLLPSGWLAALFSALLALGACQAQCPGQDPGPWANFTQTKLSGQPETYRLQFRTRGRASLRAVLSLPPKPLAVLVMFVGGDGYIGIGDDGGLGGKNDNFLVRARELFLNQGLATLYLDLPSDVSPDTSDAYRTQAVQAQDTALAVDYPRAHWPLPVVLVGTSRGTISAANAAARLSPGLVQALVLTSSVLLPGKRSRGTVFSADLSQITVPTLVAHNPHDGCELCPYSGIERLIRALTRAAKADLVAIPSQGGNGGDCLGLSPHGYFGAEAQAVAAISAWIKAQDLKPGP